MHPAKFARLMRVAIIGRPNVGKVRREGGREKKKEEREEREERGRGDDGESEDSRICELLQRVWRSTWVVGVL